MQPKIQIELIEAEMTEKNQRATLESRIMVIGNNHQVSAMLLQILRYFKVTDPSVLDLTIELFDQTTDSRVFSLLKEEKVEEIERRAKRLVNL